ncbi:DUF4179 domain-containing protein [Cohnella sp. AR92]|uniref:DUF4179 domain-containing protein n=1 Tax=Cohnella sp. AR92 TaxID=648716 RepID=UPI000F8E7DD9|nr:DUF4179 domain-containing protein [Cohnella sp. AR92]RUS45170.1 DUF4179 domain-containing protein [Cohnella sp. AR92]
MNEWIDEDMRLKQALSHEPETIPPIVREKMDRLYASLPELAEDRRRYARGRQWRLGVSVVALVAIIVTAALSTTATSNWLRQLAGGDWAFTTAGSGSISKGQTVVDQGIELTLNRVIYDGTKLAAGFRHAPGIQIKPSPGMLHINGVSAKAVTQMEDDRKNETLVIFSDLLGHPSGVFELELQVNNVVDSRGDQQEKIYGNWVFRTTVQDWTKNVREVVYDPPLKASGEGIDLTVTGLSVSPLTAKLTFEIADPTMDLREQGERNRAETLPKGESRQVKSFNYRVFDELGNELPQQGMSGVRVNEGPIRYTAEYDMVNPDAKELRLSVVESTNKLTSNGDGSYSGGKTEQTVDIPITKKTPFTVELGESASIEFRRIDLGRVKTTIDYVVKGDYPYQGIAWVVVNEWGMSTVSLFPEERIRLADEAYSFRGEIAHLDDPSKYSIRAIRVGAANVRPIPGLELAIPIEQRQQ